MHRLSIVKALLVVLPTSFRSVYYVSAFTPNHTLSSFLSPLSPGLKLQSKYYMSSSRDVSSTSAGHGLAQAKEKIASAIQIGAPAYNAGDIDECTRVYQETALEIVHWIKDFLPLYADLQETIVQVANNGDDSKANAWALRGQFDAILEFQPPFTPESSNIDGLKYELDPFTERMLPSDPLVVNDNVMGGVSQGGWNPQTRTFSGSTSLANNGGFASLRWRAPSIQNWSYAQGIYLKGVTHEDPNHTFRIIIKDTLCEQVRLSNYKAAFSNPSSSKMASSEEGSSLSDGDSVIFIPFSTFDQMEQMGRPMAAPAFNAGAVTELGIMAIKPTVVGDFSLRIAEWGLYR